MKGRQIESIPVASCCFMGSVKVFLGLLDFGNESEETVMSELWQSIDKCKDQRLETTLKTY